MPMTPSGSRTKILISSQVSCQSPRSMVVAQSRIEWPVSFRKTSSSVGMLGPEVGDVDPMLRQALDHGGHEVVAARRGS